jgi:predicted ribosome-associated RNA-binding protein Tma20
MKNEEKEEIISRLEGKIGFEIEFTKDSYGVKMQISNENNFVAFTMAKDALTSVIKHQAIPTLTAKDKMPKKLLEAHIDARNLIENICSGLGSHIHKQVIDKKIKPSILEAPKPTIILPNK